MVTNDSSLLTVSVAYVRKHIVQCLNPKAVCLVLGFVASGIVMSCTTQNSSDIFGNENTLASKTNDVKMTPELYREMLKAERKAKFTPEKIAGIDKALEKTAAIFATFVSDKSVADIIYAETMKKFDGETEVLLSTIVKQLTDLKLLANVSANPYTSEIQAIEEFTNAPIHLYWYNAEKWDKKILPIIAFVKSSQQKERNAELDGYTADGKKIKVSKEMADNRPVIIVTFNEHVKINPNKVEIELPKSTPNTYQSGKSFSSISMLGAPVSVELTDVSVHGQASDFEGWFGGRPEFYYIGWQQSLAGDWQIFNEINGGGGRKRFFHYQVIPKDPPKPMTIKSSWGTPFYTWTPIIPSTIDVGYPYGFATFWNDRGYIPSSLRMLWIDFWEEDLVWPDGDDYLENHQIGSTVVTGQVFKQNSPIEARYRTFR